MDSTVFLTVISGVVVFVSGQIILKFIIEPVQDLRKTIGEIAFAVFNRENFFQNPGVHSLEEIKEVSREIRSLAARLQAHLYTVPFYNRTATIFKLPSRNNILDATGCLIGLSNSIGPSESSEVYRVNAQRTETVRDSLGIFMQQSQRWPKEFK